MSKQQQALFQPDPAPWELDDADERLVATVVFPEAPHGPFDYAVPGTMRETLAAGCRVRVPLGRGNRLVVGYCVELRNGSVGGRRLKDVQGVLDSRELLSPAMLRLTKWMSDYYLCPWGQVLEAVIPAGVRGRAGTRELLLFSVPTNVAARVTQLKLPRKQAEVLRTIGASASPLSAARIMELVGCTMAPLNALRDKKLVKAELRRVQHTQHDERPTQKSTAPELNDDQRQALGVVLASIHSRDHETILIHGVTGSGKTEVYIQAIDEVIQFGRQAIVLVPEISLTPQTKQRFRSRFERVAVLHSNLSPAERHWHWQQIARGNIQVVVGARSAIFAPTPHLGLIVLDEEHDSSFKQDTMPRYHARDVAIQRAKAENIPLVLGSATPSLESWYAAQTDPSVKLVDMPRRVLNLPLPHVGTIDLRTEFENKYSRGAISQPLRQAMDQALKDNGQVILLLNRRGFSTSIQCPACGHVVKCADCDIALTHHREGDKAVCHYCDFETKAPHRCPECNFEGIRYAGLGTQKLEAEVHARFPNMSCLRMDSDTMQKPGSHEAALARFRSGDVKILLGTQMIAKGLDFPNVTLVGVINADTALHFPDFRASERTFQLVTQVAGRTGRGDRGGRVLVQTFSPDHPAIVAAARHDYVQFAENELPTRQEFGYPQAGAMHRVILRGTLQFATEEFAGHFADQLRERAEQQGVSCRILGAAPAPIEKVRGKFRFHILIQGPQRDDLRRIVSQVAGKLKPPEEVQWVVDVDPFDML